MLATTFALPYSRLAAEYDSTVGKTFFHQTREFFERLVRNYGIKFRSAADIGCGTGLFARHLNITREIPVFAIDLSKPMLRVAVRNCRGTKVVLLHQDIRSLQLPFPVDLITANFDTLNHLVRPADLGIALRRIFANLNPGGHFIFDVVTNCLGINTTRPYVRRFHQVTQAVRLDHLSNLLSIVVSIRSPGRLRPIVERHVERVYSLKELGDALHEAGFTIRGVHDAATLDRIKGCPPRITVVATRSGAPKERKTMYITTRTSSTLHGTFGETRSAEERIWEGDFEKVLKVLAGPSPWQQYLSKNLQLTRKNVPRRPFRVVNRKEFEQALGSDVDVSHIPGATDKRTGTIWMLEFFGGNSQATYLHAALHEAVHWVSHHPGKGPKSHSTGWDILGEGLLEGLVECITIDILNKQNITLPRREMRGHQLRVPVAVELVRKHGKDTLARVLFAGEFQDFVKLMHQTYSWRGWEEIKSLTTANKPKEAIERMNKV